MTRIVALSATPGADVPSVKQVLQNLFSGKVHLVDNEHPTLLHCSFQEPVGELDDASMQRLEVPEKLL